MTLREPFTYLVLAYVTVGDVRVAHDTKMKEFSMKIGMMGLAAVGLLAAASANAGYTWSNLQGNAGRVEKSVTQAAPAASVAGYTWSNLNGDNASSKKPQAATRGYTWSNLQGDTRASKAPVAVVRGYTWSN